MSFPDKPKVITATLLLFLALAFLLLKQVKEVKPEAQVAIPTLTPTASPSATPTPRPLTFGQMNARYGPCASLPVLMYHHIQNQETAKENGNGNLTVYPETFESQLAYLNDKGYVSVGPADLIAFFDRGQSLPKKAVLLTFDDAYDDFANSAAPLLTRYAIKGTVFVPTGLVENPGYLSWSTIQSLAGGGFYFGNHTWSHQNMGANLETIKREVETASNQLTEKGLDPLKVFAYPYGTISQKAISFLSDSGFSLAFTTQPGRILCAKQRLTLPRLRIGNTSLSAYGL